MFLVLPWFGLGLGLDLRFGLVRFGRGWAPLREPPRVFVLLALIVVVGGVCSGVECGGLGSVGLGMDSGRARGYQLLQ